jgi:uncharacterized protein YdhG (YjbR/CyaY superfamily)
MAPSNPNRDRYWPAIEKKHGLPMSYWFDQMKQLEGQKYPEQVAYLKENHGFSQAHANALVLYCRGNTTSKRFNTIDEYLAGASPEARAKVNEICDFLQKKFKKSELVIAWNQPMLKVNDQYVFGMSVLKNYLLMAPWSTDVLHDFLPRLEGYIVNKKTIQIPFDWKLDKKLLTDMVSARIAESE